MESRIHPSLVRTFTLLALLAATPIAAASAQESASGQAFQGSTAGVAIQDAQGIVHSFVRALGLDPGSAALLSAEGKNGTASIPIDPNRKDLTGILEALRSHRGGLTANLVPAGAEPEGDSPSGVVFTPDGARILVAHRESGNVLEWDAETGAFLREIVVSGSPAALAVTSDGAYAVTANVLEDTASILDLATGSEVAVVPVGNQPALAGTSPDGSLAVIGNTIDGTLSVIDLASRTEIRRIAGLAFTGLFSINFENGSFAFTFGPVRFAGNDRTVFPDMFGDQIQIVTLSTGAITNVPAPDEPRGLVITDDGTRAVTAHTGANVVTVLDLASGTITATFPIGADVFGGAIAVNPAGTVAVVSILNACRMVDLTTGALSGSLNTASVNELHTTSDGAYAFAVGYNGALLSYATQTLVKNLNLRVSLATGAVSPTAPRAAGAANSFGEDLLVFNTNGAAGFLERHSLTGPDPEGDKARQMAISTDGSIAAVTQILSDNVGFHSFPDGALLGTVAAGDRPSEVAFTPDGSLAVVANLDAPFASIIDVGSFTVTNVPISTRAAHVEISPDGAYAYLAVVVDDGVWRIDLATKTVAGPKLVTGNMGAVGYFNSQSSGMTLSHDGGTLVVCGSFSDNITLIDTATWTVAANVPVGTFPTRAIFRADDAFLYVADRDFDIVYVVSNAGPGSAVIDAIPVGDQPYEMQLSEDGLFLYVLNFASKNIGVVDLETNTQVRTIPLADSPAGLAISGTGTELYVPTGNWSLSIGPGPIFDLNYSGEFSVFDRASETLLEQIDVGLPPAMLAYHAPGDVAAVPSTFLDGYYTVALADPSAVEGHTPSLRARAVPNPASDTVEFVLAGVAGEAVTGDGVTVPGATRVTVFDAGGRLVRVIGNASVPLTWDLRDASGKRVRSGVYWARIERAGFARDLRVVVR